ncbi:uncharacterized protein LOC133204458 isoform X1 [Saccostrea echinata]|uniref:uncharacterized protein LOC133204458 isoform X1 n=1 Tax=Saccostrea echinata TaxID=191078 RepID=UPI002A83A17E|nr:uncharacterized protein LOC133204458 isoform X1 [Saccostrea echinata]
MAHVTRWTGIIFIFVGFLCHITDSTTLCAQCDSKRDPQCESNPPNPSDCLERTSKRNGCLITRIYVNGRQTAFVRSCSTLDPKVNREGCVNDTMTANKQTCYILCFEDGCNNSYVISGYILHIILLSMSSLIISKILSRNS